MKRFVLCRNEILLLLLSGFILASCTSTSVVMLDDSSRYTETTDVQILASLPNRPYKEIAILETIGDAVLPTTKLLENMREEARAIGADAVIPTQDASRRNPQGVIYNPFLGGYQTSGGGTFPVIMGVAIKFTE